jgi:hypothetical protein
MTSNRAEPDPERLAVVQFDALKAALCGRGFLTVTSSEGGKPSLRVANREASGYQEDIALAADDTGSWWFWWSWGDQIAPTTDVEAAAFKIAYVLTPQAGG